MLLHINPGGHSAWEKDVGGEQEMMEAGDKETLEGQTTERKRKRSDGMNICTLLYSIQKTFGGEMKLGQLADRLAKPKIHQH